LSENPYSIPKADMAATGAGRQASPALWNPGAAANWCLLFSVAFGAFLHMKNWEALGEPEKARTARNWFIAGIVWLAASCLLDIVAPGAKGLDALSRLGFLVLLISWYFSSAKAQIRYVQQRFGKDYVRRPWGKPFLFVLAAFVGLVMAIAVLTFIQEMTR
jgi:hypothetical protein